MSKLVDSDDLIKNTSAASLLLKNLAEVLDISIKRHEDIKDIADVYLQNIIQVMKILDENFSFVGNYSRKINIVKK